MLPREGFLMDAIYYCYELKVLNTLSYNLTVIRLGRRFLRRRSGRMEIFLVVSLWDAGHMESFLCR